MNSAISATRRLSCLKRRIRIGASQVHHSAGVVQYFGSCNCNSRILWRERASDSRTSFQNLVNYRDGLTRREFRSLCSPNLSKQSDKVKEQGRPPTVDELVFSISSDSRRQGRLRRKDIEPIIKLLEEGESVGEHGTFLLSCLGPTLPDVKPLAKITMAGIVWKAIDKEGKLTFESLDALLKCYAQNECKDAPPFDSLSLLRQVQAALTLPGMDGKDVKPSQKSYYYVLLSYCLKGDMTNAIKILNLVKDDGIPVGEDYFNALIIGNARAGDVKGAQGIVDTLEAVNLEPTGKTYATLMQVYIENKNMAELEKTYYQAKDEVTFSQLRILKLLQVSAVCNNDGAFRKILDWMSPADKFSKDAANTILSLVHLGYPKQSLDLLLRFAHEEKSTFEDAFGAFLLREMVTADIELPMISSVCDALVLGNHNVFAWNAAAETSLKLKKFDKSYEIFEEMRTRDKPLRPHYFWPIINQEFEQSGVEGLIGVIHKMSSLGVKPDWETIYEFFIPKLFTELKNPLQVAKCLKESGNLSYSSGILKAILLYLLKQKRFTEAKHLVKGTLDQPQILVDNLFVSLFKFEERENLKENLDSALLILKSIYENTSREDKTDYVGHFVLKFIDTVGAGFPEMANKFIADIHANDIQFSKDAVSCLKAEKHLVIGDLAVNPHKILVLEHSKVFQNPKEMNALDLASHSEELKAKGMNQRGTMRQLFIKSCQVDDLVNILKLKKLFETNYGGLSSGMSSSLLGAYLRLKMLQPAMDLFKEIRSTGGLEMDSYKVLDLATLMVENNKTEEAYNHLIFECGDSINKNHNPKSTMRNCVALLEAFHTHDKSGHDEVQNVLEFLLERRFVEPTAPVLGIVIKHFIEKNDLAKAVNLFVEYSARYGITPCRQLLTCCVLDNSDMLERVLGTCKLRHGEINTKHNYAFSLCESNRIAEAANIFSELIQSNRLSFFTIIKQVEYNALKKEIPKILNVIDALNRANPSTDCSSLFLIALKSCEITRNPADIRLLLSRINEQESYLSSTVLCYADRLKSLASEEKLVCNT